MYFRYRKYFTYSTNSTHFKCIIPNKVTNRIITLALFYRKINSIKYSSSCLKTARSITRTQFNRCINTYKFIWLIWYKEYGVKSLILCRDSVLNHVSRHIYYIGSCLQSDNNIWSITICLSFVGIMPLIWNMRTNIVIAMTWI